MPKISTMRNMKNFLLNQRGAMFGVDARIALIVASVLAAVGGLTIMSRLERSKVEAAEVGVELIRDALANWYRSHNALELPETLNELFDSGYIDNPSLRLDPWGQPWNYIRINVPLQVQSTEVNVNMATVVSAGKDGIADSLIIGGERDYALWEPLNDDIGAKFSTINIERQRVDDFKAQARLIVDKLSSYEQARYLEADGSCASDGPSWCEEEGGINYRQFNYYPRSDLDRNEDVTYYSEATGGSEQYIAGDPIDMERLMRDIGLPASYAVDPWQRTLYYQSNVTGRGEPPFSASVCFSHAGSCF